MVKTKQRKLDAPPLEKARPHAPRAHLTWMKGDVAHQGDLVLVCLSALPISRKPRDNRQMADGDTRGSKHILQGGIAYDADPSEIQQMLKADAGLDVDTKYIGPVFSGACTLTHPQHQHQQFPDHACTAVVYQRNLDAEEREVRQRD